MPSERPLPPEASVSPPPPSLSWWLLAAAFSPILLGMLAHAVRQPWAGYSLVFLALFVLELRRAPEGARRPVRGWAVLGVALVVELLLVGGGLTRAARPALALAALGMAWIQGRPGPRTVALLLWFVPVPSGLVSWASPALAALWGQAVAGLVQLVGSSAWFEARHDGPILHLAHASLPLIPSDGGLPMAALLSGLAWYAGLRRAAPLPATLARAAAVAALAAPIQVVAIACAAAVADAGGPGRAVLDLAPWTIATTIGLVLACRAPRGRDAEPLSSAPA